MYSWNDRIESVQGVGPQSAKLLKRAKVHTVGDLLEYKPSGYYLPCITDICSVRSERHEIIRGRVVKVNRQFSHTNYSSVMVDDNTGIIECRWYNHFDPYGLGGEIITFYGKVKNRVMQQPEWNRCINPEAMAGGIYGNKTDIVRATLWSILEDADELIKSWWVSIFRRLHYPRTHEEYKTAIDDLKYYECLILQLAMEKRRNRTQSTHVVHDNQKARPYFPYVFTQDQQDAITEVMRDIGSGNVMNRLLHGEVGSGKTTVAFYAAISLALKGHRTLILAPTTILAQQHYDTLIGLGWEDTKLIIGKVKKTENPSEKILIGTHALLNDRYALKTASLIVVDEQQKFGVEQRSKLVKHGNPHILQMSATPIPRSLAMTVFGDTDMSILRQSPVNRGPVVTKWVLPEKRGWIYNVVEHHLLLGHQAYIVYPRINESNDMESVIAGLAKVRRRFADKYTIGVLTGVMDQDMKSQQLRAFKQGEYNILVSTVIAEVGIDNQNATVMVIEGADRFGLSQLHQLRGRVCRAQDTSFCFLVAETDNDDSIARLDVMEKTNDGFTIAEQDLRLRGPGGILSFRQHGIPELRFADLVHDFDIFMRTKKEAASLVCLESPGEIDSCVVGMLEAKYGKVLQLGGV